MVVPALPVPAVYAEKSIDSTSLAPPSISHALQHVTNEKGGNTRASTRGVRHGEGDRKKYNVNGAREHTEIHGDDEGAKRACTERAHSVQ